MNRLALVLLLVAVGKVGQADKPIAMGQAYKTDRINLKIVSAKIGKVPFRSFLKGEKSETDEKYLMLQLAFTNTSERQKMNFRSSNDLLQFSKILVTDDVKNKYDSIDLGENGLNVKGRHSAIDDILPGKSGTHIHAFEVPLPKTKYLDIKIDMKKVFKLTGFATFRIPADKIQGL